MARSTANAVRIIAARVQLSHSPLVVIVDQSVRSSDCESEDCEFKSRRSPNVRGVGLVWSGHHPFTVKVASSNLARRILPTKQTRSLCSAENRESRARHPGSALMEQRRMSVCRVRPENESVSKAAGVQFPLAPLDGIRAFRSCSSLLSYGTGFDSLVSHSYACSKIG